MKVYYNNRIGISTNQFPTSQHMNSNDVANNWMELVVDGENKVNFIDDEHIQLSILPLPRFYAFTVFKIVWTNKSAANPTTTRYYQIEKVHKIASNRIILNLKIEPYLSYIYFDGLKNGDATNGDVAGMFKNTLYTLIRSPHLPITSLNYRDPLMEEIIKGCNRVPVRETPSKTHQILSATELETKINVFASYDFNPPLIFNTEQSATDWRNFFASETNFDGMPWINNLSYFTDQYTGEELRKRTPIHSSKYAVFVIPANDWRQMCEAGGSYFVDKIGTSNYAEKWLNIGNRSLSHMRLPSGRKQPFVFTLSTIFASYFTKARRYRYTLHFKPITYIAQAISGTTDTDLQFQSINKKDADGNNIPFNIPFNFQDVVIKVPLFEKRLMLGVKHPRSFNPVNPPNGVSGSVIDLIWGYGHKTQGCENTTSRIQQYFFAPGIDFGKSVFEGSKNLGSYFKGVFYGQAYSKNETPIMINFPDYKPAKEPSFNCVKTPNSFLAYISSLNDGEEWYVDISRFETVGLNPKKLTENLNSRIYNWGHGNIDSSLFTDSWALDHIYFKQYLDFSIGDKPFNLSLMFASMYTAYNGDAEHLENERSLDNIQTFYVKTHFINGFVHSWYDPSYNQHPTSHNFSSRSGYAAPSALSEYQQWLTANANVLESGKTNAISSLLSGITSGMSNLAVGAISSAVAPSGSSALAGGSANYGSGINTFITSAVNYTNTIRSINAQKADARASSGSVLLGATTDFIKFEMLSKIGVDNKTPSQMQISSVNTPQHIRDVSAFQFLQTAEVNDLSLLVNTMKQTLYYNGYYGVVNARIKPESETSYGNHPRFYELADNNALMKASQSMMGWTDMTRPGADPLNFDYNSYDGQRWIMWYIDKLTQGVMFYNKNLDDVGDPSEQERPITKVRKQNVSKKKTKKN